MVIRYSDEVMEHFRSPRNVGEIRDADGMGLIGDPSCGDSMQVWIKVDEKHHISEIKFKCKGCPAAIAVGSAMTEMAMGMHLDDAAEQITNEAVEMKVGGLPPTKRHCSNLAAATLNKAILDYILK